MDNAATPIGPHSEVLMHFTLSLEDGTVADSTEGEAPMQFTMGDGTLARGLELALLGLKVGDKQTLRIGPEHAFGPRDPAHIHTLERSDFSMDIEPGMIVGFVLPSGEEVAGAVLEINGDVVTVDFNHPMAGHEVTFVVEIMDVR